ncbi:DsbA family oxidoreductase [Pseudoxanthomonas helianthi]|uniref:DsbA family oxidoreductase n=1 Tax=Pseudoxanthomonas helianthi TaxID=1453541 RepID=A0A940X197_9GAMM|nr:DsbA family oxidoreductase [Pseudoxanthomonas helianthi]MBP3982840.1 DsbA family oxidoreductase [Pseudoxanthomonas helianthi]
MTTLRIDFVSDVVCPWCAIGLASLDQALQRLAGEVQADIHFQPFELNPQMPVEGESIAGHLQRKYGLTDAQLAENQERIRRRGAELGFVFDFNARSRIYNTFDAHRLLHWAELEGRQPALKHALLRAYFSEGKNVSDRDTLVAVAAGVGLDAERARTVLDADEYATEVREAEQFFMRNGINGVPAIIIERKHLISGGQSPEVFEQALRQIATAKGS